MHYEIIAWGIPTNHKSYIVYDAGKGDKITPKCRQTLDQGAMYDIMLKIDKWF